MGNAEEQYRAAQANARVSIALTAKRTTTCENDHPLSRATFPTPSVDNTRIYVVCSCGQRRWVTPEAWEKERKRRKKASSGI